MNLRKTNPENEEYKNILTDLEIRSLMNTNRDKPDHFVRIRFLIMFGLKPEELISIRCGDVDLENQLLMVRGRKNRYLKISSFLLRDFYGTVRHKNPEEYLFPGRNGKLHPKTIQKFFEKLERKTGIQVSCSKIRETIAVQLSSKGFSIQFIAGFLGLKTRRAVYQLIGKKSELKAVEKFSLDEILDIELKNEL
ncbi:tyrosine-type recombinase/integrase [Leptospira kirschneri]|uniref:Site-specific recombinase, phage integrase family n=1 Tax=Leptospira kirschneri str. 200802841 TaxID=1193047 RepID=A0A828Y6W9_9LEPT|nr:site-specific integrase [Leptospira kirschneri]EMO77066.1 site-specific recombinase, phage integrase family [Leptospira kirschneri str. 200801925]EJO69729.1 site-specific recombinase, phage integrase family [Leptospira kirschneri serovar Grippotyphosa str. RM52]EKO52242.1 site-specific recombinase, phage integrase family [Leptospira kirschneri str. 200802841]EKP06210.1 site-specific recombinase, phage integrase family [Leptospira kirschneri str. 2008720114]EKQ85124.1 site-specific recombina